MMRCTVGSCYRIGYILRVRVRTRAPVPGTYALVQYGIAIHCMHGLSMPVRIFSSILITVRTKAQYLLAHTGTRVLVHRVHVHDVYRWVIPVLENCMHANGMRARWPYTSPSSSH